MIAGLETSRAETPSDLDVALADERNVMPLREVAKLLGVGYRTLWLRAESGVIPAFRLDRKGNYQLLKSTVRDIVAGKYNTAQAFDEVGALDDDQDAIERVAASVG